MMESKTAQDWLGRMKAELIRDKQKAAIVAVLAVVCAVMVVRAFLKMQPVTASASTTAAPIVALTTATDLSHKDESDLSLRRKMDLERREDYLSRMERKISRDLFKSNPEAFPVNGNLGDADVVQVASVDGPGWLHETAQYVWEKQAAQRDEVERLNLIRFDAKGLSLQSTMMGTSPTALINGQVLHVGDAVGTFVVKGISASSCVVSRDGVNVEVPMCREKAH